MTCRYRAEDVEVKRMDRMAVVRLENVEEVIVAFRGLLASFNVGYTVQGHFVLHDRSGIGQCLLVPCSIS